MQMEPRGGMDGNGGGGGWGAPPPVKPASAAGGGWGAPQGPARGSGADQWHSESPSAARRMDDGGTSIWGKSGGQSGAPGGGKPPFLRSIATNTRDKTMADKLMYISNDDAQN